MQAIGKLALVGTIAIAAAALLPVAPAEAQVVAPQPREQISPEQPKNRFGMPVEGWVVLRYAVLADGHTANVRVVEHMPASLSEREAVTAVKAWTFEPATADGKPIDWHNNESVVVYHADASLSGPTPPFLQAYRETDALVQSGDHEKALKSNERMLSMSASRLIEVGIAEVQNAMINMKLGDLHAAYAAILRATDPRIPVLEASDLSVALQYRNILELELGDLVGTISTFARRSALEPVPDSDPVASRVAAIEDALGGDGAIVIKAKIADDRWRHVPSRRTFAIADVVGDVKSVQVECDRGSTEIEYAPDSELTLPASWGACALAIEGRNKTEFQFYEFP
jgi:TonB family protein